MTREILFRELQYLDHQVSTLSLSFCIILFIQIVILFSETYARVMDRSRDRVDSVVFFVRDKLRLEVSEREGSALYIYLFS